MRASRCGKHRMYRDCHLVEDLGRSTYSRFIEEDLANRAYLAELRRRDQHLGAPLDWS